MIGGAASAQTAIYRVRVASFKQPFDQIQFAALNIYGKVTFETADNGFTRVYLGYYLGKPVAKKVAALVKKKGFKAAYVVADNSDPKDANGRSCTKTWQITSSKSLDMSMFSKFNDNIRALAVVAYENGLYKYSLGYYAKEDTEAEAQMKKTAEEIGYTNGFSRTVK